jgi:predicted DNA-binding antitoxin AbrB/MazE fold protein
MNARTPRLAIPRHVQAVYEHGVFRPLEPVRLREHQDVTLVLETAEVGGGAACDQRIRELAERLYLN